MEGELGSRMRHAITLGTFDPLHAGHLGLFSQCRRLADELTVAVNTDEFVTTYRGKPPLMPEYHRMAVIDGLQMVNYVIPNRGGALQRDVILDSGADLIVIGDDWAAKDYYGQLHITQGWLDANGIQLVYVPRTGEWSSTAIKTRAT